MKSIYIKQLVTRILFILLFTLSGIVHAQNNTVKVTGTIYDEAGVTLPSVTITVKGRFPSRREQRLFSRSWE